MDGIRETLEENKKFFNRITGFYEFFFIKKINETLQKRLLNNIKIRDDSKILDAGCGTGTFLEMLYKKIKNPTLYGVDLSEKMLKVAKKRLGKKATFTLCSVENLKFAKKFDYIFNIDSFHHYADQEKAMINFYRALKGNGMLVIYDFSLGSLGNWVFKKLEPGNSKMLSSLQFRRLFKKYKFRVIKQKRIGLFSILTIGLK